MAHTEKGCAGKRGQKRPKGGKWTEYGKVPGN